MRQLSLSVQLRIVELYAGGASSRQVALAVGASKAAVLDSLRRQGSLVRAASCPHPSPTPEPVRDRIVQAYLAGANTYEVAERFGVRQSTVYNILRRRGVATRSIEDVTRNPHHVHDFFSRIDSDAKAWVLGLISSDGCIAHGKNTIKLSLQARDVDAVEKLRDLVCPTAPVRVISSFIKGTMSIKSAIRHNALVTWNSRAMVEDLASLGVTSRKSLSLRPWAGPEELMPAYFRGLVDGDGSWVRSKGPKPGSWCYSVSLVGAKAVVESFRQFVIRRTPSRPSLYRRGNVWVCKTGSLPAVRIIRSLFYDSASVWMNRKKVVADLVPAG